MNSDKIEISLDQEKDFHPELVLFGDVHVKIPVPEAKVFNNLDEYYKCSFQKKIQIEGKNQPKKPANLYERNVAFFQKQSDNDNETTRRRARELTDVMKKMEQSKKGPLSILYDSMDKIVKILIRRRKACLLRNERFSWLTGRLVAFDKHFNLVIDDALETYHHQMKSSENHHTIIRIINKQSKQLIIRGDNIVLVVRQKE